MLVHHIVIEWDGSYARKVGTENAAELFHIFCYEASSVIIGLGGIRLHINLCVFVYSDCKGFVYKRVCAIF